MSPRLRRLRRVRAQAHNVSRGSVLVINEGDDQAPSQAIIAHATALARRTGARVVVGGLPWLPIEANDPANITQLKLAR